MIEIKINSQPVLDALNRLIAAGQNMHPVLDAIGMEMESRVSARFETRTDPTGKAWAPWEPRTVKSYPKDGNRKLLDRYGDMLGSLSHQVDGNSLFVGFGAVSVNKDGAVFSYPAAHEFGTRKMVRRGLLTADPVAGTLGTGDERAIMDILRASFQNAMDGH